MVRPAIGFVKAQTTTCSAFLLGQAQDVDLLYGLLAGGSRLSPREIEEIAPRPGLLLGWKLGVEVGVAAGSWQLSSRCLTSFQPATHP